MSVVDALRSDAEAARTEADHLIEAAERSEASARRARERARTLHLQAIECTVAANIIEAAGLSVVMGEDGNPFVRVERIFAEPAVEIPPDEQAAINRRLRTFGEGAP